MSVYQFKITLKGSKPPIWRRIAVPAEYSLNQFHDVIQIAMGWLNYHLHEFQIGGKTYEMPDPDAESVLYELEGDVLREDEVTLQEVVKSPKTKFLYNYDFGDDWEHEVLLEKILPPSTPAPVCLDGRMASPPEDCGGIYGYYHLLKVLEDPKHEEYDDMVEWVGGDFKPTYFSVDEINERLKHLDSK